ncbi:MAG: DUF2442 domain-containing protein [Deltaproteobacteria bacterium]|nr:DUF2442 domain-containing protein [Deltaproteobacteria bacterium]
MHTSAVELRLPNIENLIVTEDTLTVELSDGRTISVPLAWLSRISHATPKERRNWRLIGKGQGIHWEELDEDISVEGLLAGKSSGESLNSFRKWLLLRSINGSHSCGPQNKFLGASVDDGGNSFMA